MVMADMVCGLVADMVYPHLDM